MNLSRESSISVTVRVRPFTSNEINQLQVYSEEPVFMGDGSFATSSNNSGSLSRHSMGSNYSIRQVINVVDDKMLIFDPPDNQSPLQRMNRATYGNNTKRVREHRFVFDRLFDNTATQEEVYSNTTRPLLESVLDGYNATVFAYGATGCGKTHTISGTPSEPGIIFLTMKELFERIGELKDTKHVELSLSYLEIYNETIRDLLEPNMNRTLVLREDAEKRISVSNLSTHKPQNVQEVMDMIIVGNQNRTMSPTEANATSSRSHAVLQINVSQRSRTASLSEAHTFATLSIIDLAGSERASATKNRGERLLEGANINKSLLALGNCINALCDPRRRNHIPYRDSKLTRLLKFSLGGNCKTVMIVCVSPSSKHYDETLNTLKYADRAKKIKTKVIRNEHNLNRHVGSYLKMINEQKQEIEELRARESKIVNSALANARKTDEKCYSAIADAIQQLKQTVLQCSHQRETRIEAIIKMRSLSIQIGQVEKVLKSLSGSSLSIGAAGTVPLEDVIGQSLERLMSERIQVQRYLASLESNSDTLNPSSTPNGNNSNSQSDKLIVENSITHWLRKLEDNRGWSAVHRNAFKHQAECIRLEMELNVSYKVMETEIVSVSLPTVDALANSLFGLLQTLNSLNQQSLNTSQDIKSFEIMRLTDEIIENCKKQFESISHGVILSTTSLSSSVNPNWSPFFSTSVEGPKAVKRQASASSLTHESPVPSRPIRHASVGNTRKVSDGSFVSTTNNPRQSLVGSTLTMGTASSLHKKRDSIASIHNNSNSTSSGPSVSPRKSRPSLINNTIGSSSMPIPIKKSVSTSLDLPSSPKKQQIVVRSPLKNHRKAIKRVRWEDYNDDEHENEGETTEFGDSTANNSSMFHNSSYSSSSTDIEMNGPSATPLRPRFGTNTPSQVGHKNTPTRIGLVTPRGSLLTSTVLGRDYRGTPSSLPRFNKSFSPGTPRTRNNMFYGGGSIGGSGTMIGSVIGGSGVRGTPIKSPVRPLGISVVSPVSRSMMGEVLFNNEPPTEDRNDNDHNESDEHMYSYESHDDSKSTLQFSNKQDTQTTNILNESNDDQEQDNIDDSRQLEDISIDSLPERPAISSDAARNILSKGLMSKRNSRISLDPMEIDEDDLLPPVPSSAYDFGSVQDSPTLPAPPQLASTTNRPKFGVKGDLRRKSGVSPMMFGKSNGEESSSLFGSKSSVLSPVVNSPTTPVQKSGNGKAIGRPGMVSSVISSFENNIMHDQRQGENAPGSLLTTPTQPRFSIAVSGVSGTTMPSMSTISTPIGLTDSSNSNNNNNNKQ